MSVVKLCPPWSDEDLKRDAIECLEEMKSEGFTTVIVHGFKDGAIYTKTSKKHSALEILGALEAAKVEVWER